MKSANVEFSYFPTAKTTRRAGLQTKAYTTDAWAVIHSSVRRIKKRSLRASAVPFAEQANEFYSAAMSHPTARARPLLLYYAFLNLAKAICLCRGNGTVVGSAMHGLRELRAKGKSIKSAKVEAHPSKGKTINMFDEFMSVVEGTRLQGVTTFRMHDLVACSLIGHRLWCDATTRGDRFLRLNPIELVADAAKKQVWLRAWLEDGSRERSNLSGKEIGARGFDGDWRQVKAPPGYRPSLLCWEMSSPIKYTGRPSDVVEALASHARTTLYRSLTVAEPFRNYYVYVPPKRFKKHHQMASRYVLLFYLGSVTRYHPADFDDHMNSEFGPFLSEFLASEPSQMLFELACIVAGREVVSVGLA